MSLSREQVLKQLGLMPQWRLREDLAQTTERNADLVQNQTPQEPAPTIVSDPIADMDWATLNQYVTGAGDQNADWVFVGEAAMDQDATSLLDKMLKAIQLERGKNVYLTQLSNTQYFKRQIELIQPKIIFVFGEQAAQALLQSQQPLHDLRGKVHQYEGVALIVSFPPSHLLQHTQDKALAWADLCMARDLMQVGSDKTG